MTGSGPLTPPLSVLVVDDHAVFADALAFALSTDPVFGRVGTSGDAAGAVAAMEDDPYALLVVDVDLGTARGDGEDGIALAARLLARWPASRAVVLTAHPLPQVVRRATAAGAVGVLAKGAGLDEVTAALLVAAGRSDVAAPFVAAGADDEGASLTTREVEVLQLLADGLDVRDDGAAENAHGTASIALHVVTGLLTLSLGVLARSTGRGWWACLVAGVVFVHTFVQGSLSDALAYHVVGGLLVAAAPLVLLTWLMTARPRTSGAPA
ncbi:response regulator transcription factor [Nocardioides alkalitolerans]|uniref:response regulator transcription factor n=1 Tax=Nocardioides alkalitolerans TaxID=281714 RepID=UPI000420C114|nr:response regulator transcription factor [Nocardioides alkalitolerans]